MIPLNFLTRYAVPLIAAAIYLGDTQLDQQVAIFDKTMRLADEALFQGRKEGHGNETFDFIIVGGGSAGAVLANRLSASGQHSVLLLEAGGDPNPVTTFPSAFRYFWKTGVLDWGYSTVKQENACGSTNGHCDWPRGKTLGGCSSINGLYYNRCKPQDYCLWANFTGDQSWSWENIKDTYNSFEDYHGYYEDTAEGRHGFDGEMYISNMYAPGAEVLEEAVREKGYPLGDLNAGEKNGYGFSRVDKNYKDGMRWGTYQAFLEPVLNRTNLVVYRYATAVKIETVPDGQGNFRATGVTYQRHGETFTAWADKEVVVSGGAVESPKLLLLSGIGPKDHLDELGIDMVLDLPAVGQHMQEHVNINVKGDGGSGFLVNTSFAVDYNTTDALLQFLENGTGPLNGPGAYMGSRSIAVLQAYTNSKQNDDMEWPDIHHYLSSQYFRETDKFEFFFSVILHRPTTSGTIRLASKNPEDLPLIDPRFLEDPRDVDRMIDGVETIMDLFFNTTTLQRYDIQPLGKYEACDNFERSSKDFWKCYIKINSNPDMHPTSTCRMGPDRTVAVTDSKLKVFGTTNLRVIDASSFPFVPTGNTNLPAQLIGVRGAEIILSEH